MCIFVSTMESIEIILAYGTGSTRLRWGTGGRYQGNQGEKHRKRHTDGEQDQAGRKLNIEANQDREITKREINIINLESKHNNNTTSLAFINAQEFSSSPHVTVMTILLYGGDQKSWECDLFECILE